MTVAEVVDDVEAQIDAALEHPPVRAVRTVTASIPLPNVAHDGEKRAPLWPTLVLAGFLLLLAWVAVPAALGAFA